MPKLLLLLFLGLASFLSSCEEEGLVRLQPEEACWNSADILRFELEKEAAQKLAIGLLFTDAYPFSNIYLKLDIQGPKGWETSLRKTETFIDPVGNWQIAQQGGNFPYNFTSFAGIDLPHEGLYNFRLTHDMRKEPLCGVEEVRVQLLPVQ